MPRLKIDSERALSFTATLIYISCCVVIHFQHWYKPIGESICASDVTLSSSDAVDSQTDPTSTFGNLGGLL